MNDTFFQKSNSHLFTALVGALCLGLVCAGVIYYYKGTDRQLERELDDVERLNHQLASESRQLQAGIASHGIGIATVRGKVGVSRKRVEHIHSEIAESAKSADRAIQIISECENIIKTVKAQK